MPDERILVVDDEPAVLSFCDQVLKREGYLVQGTTRSQEAISWLESERFDLLVIDLKMPEVDGLTVLRRGQEMDPDLTAVIITGHATLDSVIHALRAGARGFLLKPFDASELSLTVQQALDQKHKDQERLRLRAQLPVLEISQALMAEGDTNYLAGRLLEVVVREVGADRALLLLLDEHADALYVASAVGLPDVISPRLRIPVTQEVAGQPLLAAEFRVVTGVETQASFWQGCLHCADVESTVFVPLRTGKGTLGLLSLGRVIGSVPFTLSDLSLLTIIGGQVATALENARLYREIKATRDYFETVLDNLHDEVVVLNRDLSIADVNATFERRTGYSREDVVGQPCYRITHQSEQPCYELAHSCPVRTVLQTGRPARSQHVHYSRTGEESYVDVTASPLYDAQGQIAQVIEAYRDVTPEHRLQGKLASIHALGQQLVLSKDRDLICSVIVEAVENMLDVSTCNLWLLDEERKLLTCRVHIPPLPDLPTFSLDDERSIVAATARQGATLYLPDVFADSRYHDAGLGMRSELCTPLKVNGRVIGVLNAESEWPAAFDDDDQHLLDTLADQAALAIENARLLEETHQRFQQVSTLLEVSRNVATELNLPTLLQSILEAAVRSVPTAQRGSILLLDREHQQLTVAAHIGYSEKIRQEVHLGLQEGFAGWVCQEGRADIVVDARTDPRFVFTESTQDVRSIIAAPLVGHNGLVGVINLDNRSVAGAFGQPDLEFLAGLADQAALAIENAGLYKAVSQAKEEWEATFEAITDSISIHDTSSHIVRANRALCQRLGITPEDLAGRRCYEVFHGTTEPPPDCPCSLALASGQQQEAEWTAPRLGGTFRVLVYPLLDAAGTNVGVVHVLRDITRAKQMEAELVRSEKLAALGRLVASLAHEINNPLQALRSGLRLLLRHQGEEEKQQQYLQVASKEVERLIAIVERVLGFYRPSHEQPALTNVNVALDETLTLAGKRLEHGGVRVLRQLDRNLPQIEAVGDQLRQVFLNMILNALQSMPEGGVLTVQTGFHQGGNEVHITFADTGVGIPKEMMSRLFEPFSTTRTHGTGLGLAISYGIVERHGGRIEVTSAEGVGTTFTIFLPISWKGGAGHDA